jgi:Tfp pilus assembly protein PilF
MSSKSSRRHNPAQKRAAAVTPGRRNRPRGWRTVWVVLGMGCIAVLVWWGAGIWSDLRVSRPGPAPGGLSAPDNAATRASAPGARRGTPKDEAFKNQVNRGNELLAEGKPEQALQLLTEAARMNPQDEDVHYNLGLVFTRLDRLPEAMQQYEEALRIYPEYVEAHNNLGNLLMRQGKTTEAIQHFEAAISVMPDYASGHNNLGTALSRTGRTNEAMVHFKKAAQSNPDYWQAHFNVGTSDLAAGQLNEARSELETVLRLKPDFQPAKAALGEVLARQANTNR